MMSVPNHAPKHHAVLRRLVRFPVELTCRTGLHIGAGKNGDLVGSNLPVIRDRASRPLVPGSSLRGILRTGCESLIRGLELDDWSPAPESAKAEPDCPAEMSRGWAGIGIIERLFGRVGMKGDKFAYASRLKISDLACEASEAIELRDGVAIDRESRTAARGAKFDLEVVPAGSRFKGMISISNPDDHEVGLLAHGLRLLDEGMLQLGGSSARGLGWVEVRIGEVDDLTAKEILGSSDRADTGFEPGSVDDRLTTYIDAFAELVKVAPQAPASGGE